MNENGNVRLVAHTAPDSKVAEQYRHIRTNLTYYLQVNNKKVIVVTSPRYKEGKTVTVANLAVSMAQQGEKVLVIDANLQHADLHNLFRLSNTVGLTDVLNAKAKLVHTVKKSGVENLHVLTSGTKDYRTSELLSSAAMKQLLVDACAVYNCILIDTAPVLEVADTNMLAGASDGVLLVLRYNETTKDDVVETKRLLSFTNTQVIGSVLNQEE